MWRVGDGIEVGKMDQDAVEEEADEGHGQVGNMNVTDEYYPPS